MTSTDQLAGLARTLAHWARRGFPVLDAGQAEARLMVCRRCAEYEPGPGRCARCGCHMPVKARLGTARCPLGKWPAGNLTEGASQ